MDETIKGYYGKISKISSVSSVSTLPITLDFESNNDN